jgi:hypothetical protein
MLRRIDHLSLLIASAYGEYLARCGRPASLSFPQTSAATTPSYGDTAHNHLDFLRPSSPLRYPRYLFLLGFGSRSTLAFRVVGR